SVRVKVCRAGPVRQARKLHVRGQLQRSRGRYQQARSLCLKSLALLKVSPKPNHYAEAEVIQTLAATCEECGDYAEAVKLYHRSLRLLGSTHTESAVNRLRVNALIG